MSPRRAAADGPEALLLQLARGAPAAGGWPEAGDPRWAVALGLGDRHGVLPLLHQAGLPLPGPVRLQLRRARAAELLAEARREASLLRALAALAGHAGERPLPALLYKGAACARTVYPAPELRPRGDLDLLVAPEHAAEARARLERAGFTHRSAARGGPEDDSGWHERSLQDPRDPEAVVDLHRALLQPERQRLGPEGLLGRARPAPGLPGAALLPSPGDALLLCALSAGAHELRSPLVAACDLALLLGACGGPALGQAAARAREARVARALSLSLAWLERLLGPSASLCGLAVDLEALAALRAALGLPPAVERVLRAIAARYDLRRLQPGRPEQLLRKLLILDRPLDGVRLAAATLRRGLARRLRARPLQRRRS